MNMGNLNKLALTAQEALQQTIVIASENESSQAEPIHMLKALLESKENNLSAIIKRIGAEPFQLQANVDAEIERMPKVSGNPMMMAGAPGPALMSLIDNAVKIAEKLGAKKTICFKRPDEDTLEKRVAKVKEIANGVGVDFAYQCTGAPAAAADIYSYIRRGGGMCEMGFFVNNGEYSVNPHLAMCNKEINIVGSWDYSAEDYPKTMAFLKQCEEMNIPIESLITHSFPLDQMNEAMETNVAQKGIKICYIAK